MKSAQVILEEYDPTWVEKYKTERCFLLDKIGQWNEGGVEHIGSTAVPDLVAKPVIDIMFGVKSLQQSKPAIDVLIENGYEYWPYKADVMHWFCKPSHVYRTHHLHLIPFASSLWDDRIRFRDALLSNQKIANQYAALKKELALRYSDDREAYTEKKWPFIQQVLQNL